VSSMTNTLANSAVSFLDMAANSRRWHQDRADLKSLLAALASN